MEQGTIAFTKFRALAQATMRAVEKAGFISGTSQPFGSPEETNNIYLYESKFLKVAGVK
jgi:hypothetical protein